MHEKTHWNIHFFGFIHCDYLPILLVSGSFSGSDPPAWSGKSCILFLVTQLPIWPFALDTSLILDITRCSLPVPSPQNQIKGSSLSTFPTPNLWEGNSVIYNLLNYKVNSVNTIFNQLLLFLRKFSSVISTSLNHFLVRIFIKMYGFKYLWH